MFLLWVLLFLATIFYFQSSKIQISQQYGIKQYVMIPDTQTHPHYSIPVTNRFQILQAKEFPPLAYTQASIQHPSSSTQIPSSDLSKHFHTSLTMSN